MFATCIAWYHRQSLTFRLSVSILSCVFAGALGLLAFFSSYSNPIIKSFIDGKAQHAIHRIVADISSIRLGTEASTYTMKNTLKEIETSDIEMMRNILHSAIQTLDYDGADSAHAWIYVFPDGEVSHGTLYSGRSEQGEFLFNTQEIEDFYQKYPWFKIVPKEEKNFWSEPYLDKNHDEDIWVVTCLFPFKFKNSEEYNGLVAVSVDLKSLQDKLKVFSKEYNGNFLLLSQKGLYIAHPDPQIQLKKTIYDLAKEFNLPQLQIAAEELKNGHFGQILMNNSSVYGSSVIFFYLPVPDINWGVCLVFSQDKFFQPFKSFHWKIIIVLILGLIILFSFISLICHRSTKPLLDLSKIALQYGQGDFSAALPEAKSQDEIGVMTVAFHKMRNNLLRYIEMVKQGVAEQQKNKSELEIANHIQQSVLPTDFPLHPAFEVSGTMSPAKGVGGDFYDAFFIDDKHFAVVIADVSGKGIPAALVMMITKALIKMIAKTGASAAEIMKLVNNELCLNNKITMFVTAFLGILNIATGKLEYVNAGHNSPFYRDKKGYRMMESEHDIVLGGLDNVSYHQKVVQMKAGDRLFLYTDGVSEAQNQEGNFYGEDRLLDVLSQHNQSPEDTLYFVSQSVEQFVNGAERSDDITMLELLYCGADQNAKILPADVKCTDQLLSWIEEDIQRHHVEPKKQSNLIIASEEIFSNIAQYAYQTTGRVRISISTDDQSYIVRFADFGKAYNPLQQQDPDLQKTAEERNIGGLGIFLIKKMVDQITYEYVNDQNILTLKIKLTQRENNENQKI